MNDFVTAERKDVRMKMALSGQAGSGKTLGSVLIAKGLVKDLSKVGVLQTEPGRAQCYLKHGDFKVLELKPPYDPEQYVEGIKKAEAAGLKVLIIDSISDEWNKCLELHGEASRMSKNSFTAWKGVTPRHDAFFDAVLRSPIHIICTMRKKTDWAMETNSKGKQVPKKIGLADIARPGTDYKFMLQFDLDSNNLANCVKDNTSLFQGKEPFKITEEVGGAIRDWCLS